MDTLHKYSSTLLETVNEIISQQMSVELSDEALKLNVGFLDKKWRLTLNLSME
jgi:hypothetical protein